MVQLSIQDVTQESKVRAMYHCGKYHLCVGGREDCSWDEVSPLESLLWQGLS